jgi:predicted MPP superfamily phosphohydrolase
MIKRRHFLKAAGAFAGLSAGVGLYTWKFEPHWLEIVERNLPIAALPKDLKGMRLAQISDIHIGTRVSDDYLKQSFEKVKQLKPEFIVYTGDFISYDAQGFEHVREMFSHLPQGTRGTFGILGNHDYGPGWSHPEVAQKIADMAANAGVRILRNEVAEVDGLHIVGLDDLWGARFDLAVGFKPLPRDSAAIVLSHNPDTVDLDGWGDYSGWILSGHTHGGQCKPPFLPPPLLPVQNRRYTAGEYDLPSHRRMYVNRGLGHLIQVRFNVRPEITMFRLERA